MAMTGRDDISMESRGSEEQPFWVYALLGAVLIGLGVLVLGDLALATLLSTVAIGSAAIIGGGFEIAHAFWTRGWGGFAWQIFLGALYVAFGAALISRPELGAVVLTYLLGLILLTSGLVRMFLGFRFRRLAGWLLMMSGIVGTLAGVVLLSRWPISGIWAIGLLLGVDFIVHGFGWLAVAWRQRPRRAAQEAPLEAGGPATPR